MSALIHLIYISSATRWPTEEDLRVLLEQARARNQRQNITGLLVYGNATYLQVLEGSEADVHAVFDSICKDTRNTGVVKLREAEIASRDFENWQMGFRQLDKAAMASVPGFVDFFHGQLDPILAMGSQSAAIKLLLSFSGRTG